MTSRTRLHSTLAAAALAFGASVAAQAPAGPTSLIESIESRRAHYEEIATQIWDLAEVGYQEVRSSALLQAELASAGFAVERGVAGMPTAFVASFGTGSPVIGILAEFDALPGISQQVAAERAPIAGMAAGHACGHHLFGTGSVAAAVAVKEWLERSGTMGTIRVYGTPAEEGGSGKVYMVRAGLFGDVDAVLAWHPGDVNDASPFTTLANMSVKFRFRGVSAHAASAPDQGRSALDGVEAMNYMVNLMREHVPEASRIHYVITSGGAAPNVVPDFAEVYYYVRHPDAEVTKRLFERIVRAAEGAATGTGTTVEHERIGGAYNMLPNQHLGRLLDASLRKVGGYRYTPEEASFARQLADTLAEPGAIGSQERVREWSPYALSASTDVADVSWMAPTAQFRAATWVPGTPAHSWQAVAAGGMSIGTSGMMVAAKTLALTVAELFSDPRHVRDARAELVSQRGDGFRYESLVGDRDPPLDYRVNP
jgi:aminobenzoyl-glutamate utilization protein B